MNTALVTVGGIGITTALLLLYATTGVLLNFSRFDANTIDQYIERLRNDGSFEALLAGIVLYSAGMLTAGIATVMAPAYMADLIAAAFAVLLLTLLYFLYSMMRITRSL